MKTPIIDVSQDVPLPGQKIDSKYYVLSPLGQGGMARVFKALQVISPGEGLEALIEGIVEVVKPEYKRYIALRNLVVAEAASNIDVGERQKRKHRSTFDEAHAAYLNAPKILGEEDIERVREELGISNRPRVRLVAAKYSPSEELEDQNSRQRWEREKSIQFKLEANSYIVSALDTYDSETGSWFITEYVHGITVKDLLADETRILYDQSVALRTDIALIIAHNIALALEELDSKFITHNDIKPSNIILPFEGGTILLDFGIATGKGMLRLTEDESGGATIYYASPEFYRRLNVKMKDYTQEMVRDISSDVFSLGIVLYETLTGVKPFMGTRSEVARKIIDPKPKPLKYHQTWQTPKGISRKQRRTYERQREAIQRVVFRCLKSRKEDRYQDPAELAKDLRNLLYETPVRIDEEWINTETTEYRKRIAEYISCARENSNPPRPDALEDTASTGS